jgi:hypothetical protein
MTAEQVLAKLKKDLDLWIKCNNAYFNLETDGNTSPSKPCMISVAAWKCVLKRIERLEKRNEETNT